MEQVPARGGLRAVGEPRGVHMSPRVSTRLLATQPDKRLLELVDKGYERAFEAIVLRYRRPLLAYCRGMGLSEARAEDVLQQALLKAWMALQAGTQVRELRPWLYRIVHNTALNAIRRTPEEQGLQLEVAEAATAAAESDLEGRQAARDALTDVAALPPMQRQAILMSAVDGRSHAEVASALGISDGAVRGLLYRARARLRDAAAALTPTPLLAWAAGGAGRVAPAATRIAELAGSGGGDAGGALLKGAAVCLTAALAAGAVLVPLHRGGAPQRAGARRGATRSIAAPAAGGRTPAAPGGTAIRLAAATQPQTQGAQPAGGSGPVPAAGLRPRAGTAPAGDHSPAAEGPAPAAVQPTSGTSTVVTGRAAESGSSTGSGASSGGASGGAGTPPSEQPAGGGAGKEGGGEPPEAEREHSEREAEESREHQEQEAEVAREKAETEAEEARERSEREAAAAHEREAGKDS